MPAELVIVTPDHQTKRIQVGDTELTLGRAHTNDLCYSDDASLSRRHLRLSPGENGAVIAEDLGSKNGTLLNGVRLTGPQRLQPGDRLVAGHLEISLVDPDNESPVVFVPSETDIQTQGTVMTRLEDLLSSEATAPLDRPKRPQAVPGGPVPSPEVAERQGLDSPIVRLLLEAGRELASHRPLAELFQVILDLSIRAVGAERGVLLYMDGGRLVSKAVHGDQFRISAAVRDKVIQEKASLLVRDMAQEEAFRERLSISAQQIHTMMAVPLQTENHVIGLVYVDSRMWMREFTPDDLNLLTFLGNIAAIRIEQEQHAQLRKEGEQAAEIQRRILPGQAPQIPGIELAGHMAPCRTVGGDYYDFIPYEDERVAVVLADVAGKGISAAMLMSNLQARVQMLAEEPGNLGETIGRLDKSLVKACPRNRFITLFFGLVDPTQNLIDYCNAGHNPPLLVRTSGAVDRLPAAGTVLGILPELGYETQTTTIEPGELLAIFSDGVTEAADSNGEEFGEERLGQLLAKLRDRPANEIVNEVLEELDRFTESAPAEDDVTLVVVRRI